MNTMLADAAILMAIGMLTVFAFLIVLTLCVSLLTRLTQEPEQAATSAQGDAATAPANKPDGAQMAAISSAIAQYRKSR